MSEGIGFNINLPKLPPAGNVSQIDTVRVEQMTDRDGFTSVSFTSIPPRAFDQFKELARARGQFPRDLFNEALSRLLRDRQAGSQLTYLASRKGGVRRSLWLDDELVDAMNTAADEDNVSKTELFLTALRRYAEQEGIDVEV